MLNDREKLIDILECIGIYDVTMNAEPIAEALIANGVTVRKQGKWEQVFYHYKPFVPKFDEWYGAILKCSICGREEIEDDDNNYCPNCGADMRRGEEHG